MHPQTVPTPQPEKAADKFENLKLPQAETLAPTPETVEAVRRHQARMIQLALAAAESIRVADVHKDFKPNDQVVSDPASWKFESAEQTKLAVLRNVVEPLRDAERAMQRLYPADSKEARSASTALSIAIKMSEDTSKLVGLYPTPATREAHLKQLSTILALSTDSFATEQKLTEVSARKPIPISPAELKALQSAQLLGPEASVERINGRGKAIAAAAEAPTMKASELSVTTVREHQLRLLQRSHATATAMYEQHSEPQYRAPADVVPDRNHWKFDTSSRTDFTELEKLSPAELEQRRSSNAGRALEANIILPIRTISREVYLLAPNDPKRGDHPYASSSFEGVLKRCGELHAELRGAGSAEERKAVLGQLVELLGESKQKFATEHKLGGVDVNKPIPLTAQQLGQLQDGGFETPGITVKDATERSERILKVLATAKERR